MAAYPKYSTHLSTTPVALIGMVVEEGARVERASVAEDLLLLDLAMDLFSFFCTVKEPPVPDSTSTARHRCDC